jgi:hypothetical protein
MNKINLIFIMDISEKIFNIDLTNYSKYINGFEWFLKDCGEHYKLLSFLASQIPAGETVVDIGTRTGASAVALSTNPNIKVITYDIEYHLPERPNILDIPNIDFRMKDGIKDFESYSSSSLILLDVDPHDGVQEKVFINMLIENNYKGYVLCDDIYFNDEMKEFWNWVPVPKLDISNYGHWSGTGIILFGGVKVV